MPVINIRQLRDTKKLKAWLRAGKTIELRERERLIARIVPATEKPAAREMPDFAAFRKELFGDRVFSAVDDLLKQRDRL